jgi:hypothetical protein
MKQKITLGSLALLIIILISGCTQNSAELPNELPSQFNLYYSFGVGEKNVLDTKNNIYIKDMVCDSPKEYNFQLTESEKTIVYNSILENDLFNIKDEFTKNCDWKGICQHVSPLSTATLKIAVNGKTKTIKWSEDYIDKEDPELKKFQNVVNVIQNIISKKEGEMNIEQPTCHYM